MNILLADEAGFCFGVKRAVDMAIEAKKKYNRKIYTLGPLIHNNSVIEYLKEKEIYPLELDNIDELGKDDIVIIRSHGVSKDTLNMLKDRQLFVIDCTCPYVANIQLKAKKYHDLGYGIIIVGDENHPEVIGINGWCNNEAVISKDGSDIKALNSKVCVLSQTTEKQENWKKVLAIVVDNCKEIVAYNTICNATQTRQQAAEELSKKVDIMIVLGGYNSSNTTKLYEICSKNCKTIHVENSGEIPDDILKNKNINNVGVTAGASTPDWIIKEAILKMSNEENLEMNEQLAYMDQNDSKTISVGQVIKGEVISISQNGRDVFVNIGYKVDGVLPKEEVTKDESVNLSDLFNKGDIIEVKVINRKNEDGNVVLSRIELEREAAFKVVKEAFANGTSLNVTVKEAVSGGVISSINGVRIFIPASHIELFHVDNLEQYVGKEIEVKIIELKEDRKYTKIVGSRRDLLKVEQDKKEEVAWQTLEKDQVVLCEVKRLTAFGAFLDVNGVDGLLHVSEISWGRISKPSDVLKVGDKVQVYILDIDKENKKLSLSMKKLVEDPWSNVDEKYPVGNIVLGKVVRFADFGAFVELEAGVDALVHISQISHKRINKPSEALTINQQVKAKILEVNKETKKIALSIKEVDEI